MRKVIPKNVYLRYFAGSSIERRRADRIAELFQADLDTVVEKLTPHLPNRVDNILDIGAGIGGVDAILFDHLKDRSPNLWLLDKDDESPLYGEHYTGFHDQAAAYNSLALSQDFLLRNGVPEDRIHLVNISNSPFPEQTFDVVISLLSWGFHYPVETYLPEVTQHLDNDGALFIDVRRGTGGYEALASRFDDITVIDEAKKHQLICAKRPRRLS